MRLLSILHSGLERITSRESAQDIRQSNMAEKSLNVSTKGSKEPRFDKDTFDYLWDLALYHPESGVSLQGKLHPSHKNSNDPDLHGWIYLE
jgi:hypothetical protein